MKMIFEIHLKKNDDHAILAARRAQMGLFWWPCSSCLFRVRPHVGQTTFTQAWVFAYTLKYSLFAQGRLS